MGEHDMRERDRDHDYIWNVAAIDRIRPSQISSKRSELAPYLQKYLHVLGPMPKKSLEAFAGMGLSDAEIGRYYKMPWQLVTELRDVWNIGSNA